MFSDSPSSKPSLFYNLMWTPAMGKKPVLALKIEWNLTGNRSRSRDKECGFSFASAAGHSQR